jgi:atypical dual specificity phosphatase
MGAGAAQLEGATAVGEQVRRLEDQLGRARRQLDDLRRLLRHLAHDSASAAAVRAEVDAALAAPGWPVDAVAYAREVLAPVWNFAWLVPGRLAGCGRPDTQLGVRFLADQGVRTLLSLAEPPPPAWLAAHALTSHRLVGLADRAAPSPEQLEEALRVIEHHLAAGQPVAVHCQAGIGRTGTVLAGYLVRHGATAAEAIAEVRRGYHPRAVENAAQEDSVRRFADRIRNEA